MKGHMSSEPTQSILTRDDLAGLSVRCFAFVFVMVLALGIAEVANLSFDIRVEWKWLLAMFLIVAVPMLVGMVLSEVPRGNDWFMARLGVATFCRTGLPLLIVISVSQLNEEPIAESAIGFLAVFYVIGFLASVGISMLRFRIHGSIKEVGRAVV